jgi:hypothetical protein
MDEQQTLSNSLNCWITDIITLTRGSDLIRGYEQHIQVDVPLAFSLNRFATLSVQDIQALIAG